MPAGNATTCLNMIVKNETGVIRRCLASVRPFIDTWVIVDTGSTDGTQNMIREFLADLPGELHERPWKNFGANRTEALELARGKADYTMIIDADEVLEHDRDFELPPLTLDQYLTVHAAGNSGTSFYLPQFMKSTLPWRYDGVLHEHVACDESHEVGKIEGLVCRGFFGGARNVDPKAKYENDARILEQALEDEPDNPRYVFYLAQSYRDAGHLERAVEAYRKRATLGGWDEEVWFSLFQCGVLLERLGDAAAALASYLEAYQYRPTRAEPLHALARRYRMEKKYAVAHLFATQAAKLPRPDDILFLDESVYDWRSLDELGISSYYVGAVKQALELTEGLLKNPKVPESERARLQKNLEFSRNHPAPVRSSTSATQKARNKRKSQRAKGKKHRRR